MSDTIRRYTMLVWADDSTVEQIKAVLNGYHFEAAISPLHDSDTWDMDDVFRWMKSHNFNRIERAAGRKRASADQIKNGLKYGWENLSEDENGRFWLSAPALGTTKKAHYHLIVKVDHNQSVRGLLEMLEDLNIGYSERVHSLPSLVRYLCHLDDPEKAQYDPADTVALGGFDLSPLFRTDEMTAMYVVSELAGLAYSGEYASFRDLNRHAALCGRMDMVKELRAHAGYWSAVMRCGPVAHAGNRKNAPSALEWIE